jgi:hypothetical protein
MFIPNLNLMISYILFIFVQTSKKKLHKSDTVQDIQHVPSSVSIVYDPSGGSTVLIGKWLMPWAF